MIRWAAHRPAVLWAIAAGIFVSGAVAFGKLPLATRSTIEFPRLQVNASFPGASPELIETYLTAPIEGVVQGVRGVRRTSSTSEEGASTVTVDLDPGADITLARLGILERIQTLKRDLPAQANVSVSNWVPKDLQQQPLLEVNVVGPYTPGALARVVRDILEPKLSSIPGIAGVNENGGADNRITVEYDPTLLHQLNIQPTALSTALASARQVQALGEIRRGSLAMSVSIHDQPHLVADLARLPVIAPGGRTFSLGQVAAIRPEEDANGQFYRLNGQTAVSISLYREPGADAIRTAALARAALPGLKALVPPGVRLRVNSDESEDLAHELDDLVTRGAIAFASVFLVLLLSLRSGPRALLVIGSAAVAIAGAALSLYLMHIPANLLTLAGLGMGVGILVQNGLVVVERLRAARNTPDGRADAGARIAPAVLGSTLTTTVVLLPFLYLQGNTRAAFAPFAIAFALALFWSVGTSLVFVPAVGRGEEGRALGWPRLGRLYERMVAATLRWRYLTLGLTVVALAVLTWGFIKKVPRVDWGRDFGAPRTTITASVGFPRGSDPAAVEHIISELEADAVGQPGVALVRSTGNRRNGNVNVEFTAEGSASDAPWVVSDKLTERAVLVGGTDNVSVSKPEGPGFYSSSGGSGSVSRRITILGYSYEGVLQMALDLKARLERIPRVRDVDVNGGNSYGSEHAVSVSLAPDRTALGRIGASAQDYSNSVSRQIRGISGSTTLQEGDDEVEVLLRAAGASERDIGQLSDALVSNPRGVPTRIGDVSTVGEVVGLSEIDRRDQQYVRTLTYDFRGPQKLADRVHKAFMNSITTPPGYTVADETYNYQADESAKGLNRVFALGIILVLLAVAIVFNSVWAAAMVLLALPMALGGVIAAFWFTHTAFTRQAAVGVILVVGLAVNHSILLIDAALQSRRSGTWLTFGDALHAATDRVTMIVLVTLTTLASLIPMAVGTKSDSIFGAIALATAGGTIAGTLGVMFVMPAMLMGLARSNARRSA
ncbi:MAG TPA: efflux RND transporter permease subunit [Gemmatimonadales bacterium]|jgi:HAE1 family hydrophobic/amphiphilic exporter-1